MFAQKDALGKQINTKLENYKLPVLWDGLRGNWEKVIRGSETGSGTEKHSPRLC